MNRLPDLDALCISDYQITENHMTVSACAKEKEACCPCCDTASSRVHSSYYRKIDDLSVSACSCSLTLYVRRFFCDNSFCHKKTFAEQPGTQITRYSRRTGRLQELLKKLSLEVSARKASYLCAVTKYSVSDSTLLRIASSVSIPAQDELKVVGIDDFAYKKGHRYGTVFINMITGKPIDLIQGRETQSVKDWLFEHPEIEIISRDRCSTYAKAGREASPSAIVSLRANTYYKLKNEGPTSARRSFLF